MNSATSDMDWMTCIFYNAEEHFGPLCNHYDLQMVNTDQGEMLT